MSNGCQLKQEEEAPGRRKEGEKEERMGRREEGRKEH